MQSFDDNWELQMNRALDGELSDDERLALDRELIRRPELRQAMEASRGIDELVGDALRGVLGDVNGPHLSLPAHFELPQRRSFSRKWWLMPPAAAAAVLVAMLLIERPAAGPTVADYGPAPITTGQDYTPSYGPEVGEVVPVSYDRPRIDRKLGRDVIGVIGSDGNLYLIETDHTRTVTQPRGHSDALPIGGL